jgi:hypothetical protein
MKGIYLTEEGKKAIENELTELRTQWNKNQQTWGKIYILQDILVSATILSVEESWEDVELYPPDNESQMEKTLRLKNGVIIQPKQ